MSGGLAGYPPISAYALLSDTHTAALSGPDGAVEWLCVPRFDGDSLFARLLDRRRGGALELSVEGAGPPRRRYLGDTLVLESRFRAPAGEVVVWDALAVRRDSEEDELVPEHLLVRLARCTAGAARVRTTVDARPGYALRRPRWRREGDLWRAGDSPLWLAGDAPLERRGDRLRAAVALRAGESAAIVLGYAAAPRPIRAAEAARLIEESARAWQRWSDRCGYDGVGRDQVRRGAVVLRALAFDQTGALVAAPTTSLPEEIGGGRNWDYRYTWHRDASLLVLALFRLGHEAEGRRYLDFVLSGCAGRRERLAPMAGIGGELEAEERILGHLEGYARSRPVRVGNAAIEQVQLDTYGHVLDAALVYHQLTGALTHAHWRTLRHLVNVVAGTWREPDHGVWEMRGRTRHHVNSKVLAWAALDRGVLLAPELGADASLMRRWARERDAVRRDVLAHGRDLRRGGLVQAYGEPSLDAAALDAALLGFLPGDHPVIVRTLDRIAEELGAGGALVRRYDTAEVDDSVAGGEGAFLLSSFNLVSALVLAGRLHEARRRFEWLLERAGPLGLYSEEMSSDGEALGNYPQAFTHLALIQAALNLEAAGDREALHGWAARRGRKRTAGAETDGVSGAMPWPPAEARPWGGSDGGGRQGDRRNVASPDGAQRSSRPMA
ncbi:MAG TPA: glycoside hydrolase family 15 protein [Miltoncostaeaceae bacterium]|nr:glycoside hydrolase family 15 protein [Miltoncostaeaceae bacterium]